MKKLIVLVLLFSITIVSGCSREKGDQANNTQETRNILVIAPLTGPGAALGESSMTGMKMALEDINNNAIAKGKKIDLVFKDSKTDPKTAVSIFASRNLYSSEKVVISEMSGVTRALAGPARQARVLLAATLVGAPNLGGGSPYFVMINVLSNAIAPPVARYAARKHAKIGLLYYDDDYGKANYNLFKEAYEKAGGKILLAEPYSRQANTARILVDKVKKYGAKAVFIAGYGPTYMALFKSFKELAPEIQIYADIGIAAAPIFKAIGDASEGVIFAATEIDAYPPITERARHFHERFTKAQPGKRPDYITAYSYDTIMILNDAFQAVPDGNPEKIRNYLIGKTWNGFGGGFRYDPDTGDSIYEDLPLFKVENGEIKRLSNAAVR